MVSFYEYIKCVNGNKIVDEVENDYEEDSWKCKKKFNNKKDVLCTSKTFEDAGYAVWFEVNFFCVNIPFSI